MHILFDASGVQLEHGWEHLQPIVLDLPMFLGQDDCTLWVQPEVRLQLEEDLAREYLHRPAYLSGIHWVNASSRHTDEGSTAWGRLTSSFSHHLRLSLLIRELQADVLMSLGGLSLGLEPELRMTPSGPLFVYSVPHSFLRVEEASLTSSLKRWASTTTMVMADHVLFPADKFTEWKKRMSHHWQPALLRETPPASWDDPYLEDG